MKKSLVVSILVIIASFFAISATDQTNHYEVQSNLDPGLTSGVFDNKPITIPPFIADTKLPSKKVLGETDGEKIIYVDLTNQRVYAYEGDRLVYNFLVSTGKWGRTPTGTFTIEKKFKAAKMSGGSRALGTYYYLPNVPWIMFFGNSKIPASRGFAFHGAYWHNNFGHPMSHGCINMKISEAAILYSWAEPILPEGKNSGGATAENPGTKVVIYGTTPRS